MKKTIAFAEKAAFLLLVLPLFLSIHLLSAPPATAPALTTDDLYDMGSDSYNNGDFAKGVIYLFAYLQQHPQLTTDPSPEQVDQAILTSYTQLHATTTPAQVVPSVVEHLTLGSMRIKGVDAYNHRYWGEACVYLFAYVQTNVLAGGADDPAVRGMYVTAMNNLLAALRSYAAAASSGPSDNGNGLGSTNQGLAFRPTPLPKTLKKSHPPFVVIPRPVGVRTFNGFADAFPFVFNESESNFVNIKGTPFDNNTQYVLNYHPTITIADGSVTPSNIFQRGTAWAFRFVISGPASAENAQFLLADQQIQNAFFHQGLNCLKSPFAFNRGSVPLTSFQYRAADHLIQVTREIDGDTFDDEVIIYHTGNH